MELKENEINLLKNQIKEQNEASARYQKEHENNIYF